MPSFGSIGWVDAATASMPLSIRSTPAPTDLTAFVTLRVASTLRSIRLLIFLSRLSIDWSSRCIAASRFSVRSARFGAARAYCAIACRSSSAREISGGRRTAPSLRPHPTSDLTRRERGQPGDDEQDTEAHEQQIAAETLGP